MGRPWMALMIVTACGGGHHAVDAAADGPPLALDLDIQITYRESSAHIQVYTHGTDLAFCGAETDWSFPEPGSCQFIDDVIGCSLDSCLRAELAGTGVLQEISDSPYFQFSLPAWPPADLVLRLSGCGHPAFEIPLERFAPSMPTLDVEVLDTDVIARWVTDRPATSARVEYAAGLGAQDCHVVANEHTFEDGIGAMGWTFPSGMAVWTFLPVVTFSTPAGDVRVWRGGQAFRRLAP